MTNIFAEHEFGLLLFRVILGTVFLGGGFVGMVLLPLVLNKRLDPILSPTPNDPLKSAGATFHFYGKAHDYARALLAESYAQKIFGVSQKDIAKHIPTWVLPFCRFYLFSYRVTLYVIFPLFTAMWIKSRLS